MFRSQESIKLRTERSMPLAVPSLGSVAGGTPIDKLRTGYEISG